jgi:hypothetical protein
MVGNVTSRRVMDVYAKPGETLTGLPERGTQWLLGQEVRLANELTGFTDRNWGYEVMDYAPITGQVMQGGELVEQSRLRFGRACDRIFQNAPKVVCIMSELARSDRTYIGEGPTALLID